MSISTKHCSLLQWDHVCSPYRGMVGGMEITRFAQLYVYMHVHAYVHTYVYMHVHVFTYVYVHVYVWPFPQEAQRVCVCFDSGDSEREAVLEASARLVSG